MHDQRVLFTVNSQSFECAVLIVDKLIEHKLAKQISSLMDTKYGWSDGLIVELMPYKEQTEEI